MSCHCSLALRVPLTAAQSVSTRSYISGFSHRCLHRPCVNATLMSSMRKIPHISDAAPLIYKTTRRQLQPKADTIKQKTTKSLYPVPFGRKQAQKASTALCSVVLTQRGTDAVVPLVPWPVPGHQRLRVRWVPRNTHKKSSEKNNCGSLSERRLHTEVLHTRIEIVCSIEKRVTGRSKYS